MNKILLIIQREYLIRVRKKSFIIMTILGPILMASLMIVPVYLAQMKSGDTKSIAIIDESGIYDNTFENSENYNYFSLDISIEEAKDKLPGLEYYALLHIPETKVILPEKAVIYSNNQVTLEVKNHLKNLMEKRIEELKLKASGIDKETLLSTQANIDLSTIKLNESGDEEKSYAEVAMAVGFFSALVIYFFIFIFGSQVMRGVIEEKTSRIVEVIVSSVKPFQLMMGKILGIAMVGLTQILLWVVLTFGIYTVFTTIYADTLNVQNTKDLMMQQQGMSGAMGANQEQITEQASNPQVAKVFEIIGSINFGLIIGSFLFFFLFGYLMYSALFAAIGSAVDNETDTQQFMLPVTAPLILAIIVAQFVVQNPEGPMAFWFSIIPFTSPIIMMIRIPFGVPVLDMALAMFLLVAGFVFTTWLAGKIYRTGILMYGKKIDYKELWKWIRHGS
ncbi:MAG TPA: ABC transporter permease [Bacteroidales bacterium]|nr:ABC transporter permease [Bacteroidales bacterium]